jgi:uncharacterized membrane protein
MAESVMQRKAIRRGQAPMVAGRKPGTSDIPEVPAKAGSRRSLPQLLTWFVMIVFALTFAWLAVYRHEHFGTWGFDLGIYDQAFWLTSQGKSFISIRGMNMWGHHINLIVLLFVPFYWLGAGARFLVVTQAIVLSLAAIPAFRLARKRFSSDWLGLLFAVFALGYAPLQWVAWNNFHPEALAVTPLMFAWWYADERKWKAFAIASVLALTTREEAAIVTSLIALRFFILEIRARRKTSDGERSARHLAAPVGVGLFAALWFVVSTKVVIPRFNDGSEAFYIHYFYGSWGSSLPEVLSNVVKHPITTLRTLTDSSRTKFFLPLVLLLGGLSLASPLSMLILAPSVLSTGLAQHDFIRDIRYQYTVFLIPVLIMTSIEGAHRIVRWKSLLRIPVFVLVGFSLLISQLSYSPSPLGSNAGVWNGVAEAATLRDAVTLVPDGASVAADDWIVAHFSHREHAYRFPNPIVPAFYGATMTEPTNPSAADWIVTFRVNPGVDAPEDPKKGAIIVDALVQRGAYKLVLDRDNVIVAKRVRTVTLADVEDLRRKYVLVLANAG